MSTSSTTSLRKFVQSIVDPFIVGFGNSIARLINGFDDLYTSLAHKSDVTHRHTIDTLDIATTLAAKANKIHSHEITEVNTLSTLLDSKANLSDLKAYHTIYLPYGMLESPGTGTAANASEAYYTDAYVTKKGVPFPDAATTAMCFSAALPRSLDTTAPLYIALQGVFGKNGTSGNVVWNIIANCSASGDLISTTNTGVNATIASSNKHTITDPISMTATTTKKQSTLHGSIRRIGADAADTLTESAHITGIWIFYKTEKLSDSWT